MLGRRGTPADLLAVGLGNPGAEYARTRHNAGADTIALLAEMRVDWGWRATRMAKMGKREWEMAKRVFWACWRSSRRRKLRRELIFDFLGLAGG